MDMAEAVTGQKGDTGERQLATRPDRAFVRVAGAEAIEFLQGLVSQDIAKVTPENAAYGALLTPQGKFLHDLFFTHIAGGILLECEADRRDDLITRLKRYRLRAKVDIEAEDAVSLAVVWGEGAARAFDLPEADASTGAAIQNGAHLIYVDPRLAALGVRILSNEKTLHDISIAAEPSDAEAFASHRLRLGVPEGAADIAVDRGFLLESGFDELHGVDWKKGCYVGQELTARTKYRGLVKRRLMPVRIEGEAPEIGALIEADGRNAGEMRSSIGGHGLALIRLDAWRGAKALTSGDARIVPERPDWANFE